MEEHSSSLGEATAPPNRYLWFSPNKWEISIVVGFRYLNPTYILTNYGEKDEVNFTSVELTFPIKILYEDVVLEEHSSSLGEATAPPNRYLWFSPNKWEISIVVGFRYLNPTYQRVQTKIVGKTSPLSLQERGWGRGLH
ncbi:hypothetical protein [Dapis sp. BLCC M172]|uniref:hypothetical protein n=1 Tax=Dapis sp. BLCC M172 TaxID=2975281 RepID=UPI003CF6EFBD